MFGGFELRDPRARAELSPNQNLRFQKTGFAGAVFRDKKAGSAEYASGQKVVRDNGGGAWIASRGLPGSKDPSIFSLDQRDGSGRRAAPRCEGVAKNGAPCCGHRLHGSIFCYRHCRGAERDRIDAARLERQRRFAHSNCASERARALKQIRNIERRRLNRLWLRNPDIEGSTLELTRPDDRRAREFLLSGYNFDIDAVDALTGRRFRFALAIERDGPLFSACRAGATPKPFAAGSRSCCATSGAIGCKKTHVRRRNSPHPAAGGFQDRRNRDTPSRDRRLSRIKEIC